MIRLQWSLQFALYYMIRELGQNVIKHAHGDTEASLVVKTTAGWVLLRADNNGTGFPTPPVHSLRLGSRSIRDWVALLSG